MTRFKLKSSAAATATGCTVKITTDVLTNDLRNCPTLTVRGIVYIVSLTDRI
jgi:hypothetical protein